jgi:hypothetical protein
MASTETPAVRGSRAGNVPVVSEIVAGITFDATVGMVCEGRALS